MVKWGLQFESSCLCSLHSTQQISPTLLIKPLKLQYLTICCANFLGELQVSFAFQALWKLYLKKKKIEVNKKKSIYFLGCRFGCWNWLIIEENKRCLLQSTSNFMLGKIDFFNDEKKRGKTQLNYFHLPITSVKLLLIQWLARIYPLAQHLFLDMSLDFKQSLLVHTNYSFKHWFEHNNNNNSNVQFSHNLSGKHSMQSFWKQ